MCSVAGMGEEEERKSERKEEWLSSSGQRGATVGRSRFQHSPCITLSMHSFVHASEASFFPAFDGVYWLSTSEEETC